MFRNPTVPAVVDLSAAANDTFIYEAIGAGYINVDQIVGTLEEAIAAGGFSSTAPEVVVQVNDGSSDIEIANFTPSAAQLTAGGAIGASYKFTPDATNAPEGVYTFAAGDLIIVRLETQGAGGTVTGTLRVNIPLEEDLG